jgi:hypothetical protein
MNHVLGRIPFGNVLVGCCILGGWLVSYAVSGTSRAFVLAAYAGSALLAALWVYFVAARLADLGLNRMWSLPYAGCLIAFGVILVNVFSLRVIAAMLWWLVVQVPMLLIKGKTSSS